MCPTTKREHNLKTNPKLPDRTWGRIRWRIWIERLKQKWRQKWKKNTTVESNQGKKTKRRQNKNENKNKNTSVESNTNNTNYETGRRPKECKYNPIKRPSQHCPRQASTTSIMGATTQYMVVTRMVIH